VTQHKDVAAMAGEGAEQADRPQASAPKRGKLRRILAVAAIACALIGPLARIGGRYDWRLDLLSHFPEPALGVTVFALLLNVRRRPWLGAGLLVLALWQLEPLLRYELRQGPTAEPDSTARLRILVANLLYDNDRYDALVELVERERPDVLGLVEYSTEWFLGLDDLRRQYPHRADAPWGPAGLALWFRERPLAVDPPRIPIAGAWPYFHVTIDFAGQPRHLWLLHPSSPFNRKGIPELAALAGQIQEYSGSRIVIGDLNCSEGSLRFADFVEMIGLRDTRFGFGRQPSWPVWSPYRIPIDHVFVSDDLAVVDRRLGPSIGSDHFPLIIELAPAASATPRIRAAISSKSGSTTGALAPANLVRSASRKK
jgi:endonuclease/exonuclease/phosphatase (EEP) superfamily protein YafD